MTDKYRINPVPAPEGFPDPLIRRLQPHELSWLTRFGRESYVLNWGLYECTIVVDDEHPEDPNVSVLGPTPFVVNVTVPKEGGSHIWGSMVEDLEHVWAVVEDDCRRTLPDDFKALGLR